MKYLLLIILIGCGSPQSGSSGTTGNVGQPGTSCSVQDLGDEALITCQDGSSATIGDSDEVSPSPTSEPTPEPNRCLKIEHCNKANKCWYKKVCRVDND